MMIIAGAEQAPNPALDVDTIEVWYSQRRKAWFVECLDREGSQVGFAHRCLDEEEAATCVAEWLRAHATARIWSAQPLGAGEKRIFRHGARKAA